MGRSQITVVKVRTARQLLQTHCPTCPDSALIGVLLSTTSNYSVRTVRSTSPTVRTESRVQGFAMKSGGGVKTRGACLENPPFVPERRPRTSCLKRRPGRRSWHFFPMQNAARVLTPTQGRMICLSRPHYYCTVVDNFFGPCRIMPNFGWREHNRSTIEAFGGPGRKKVKVPVGTVVFLWGQASSCIY